MDADVERVLVSVQAELITPAVELVRSRLEDSSYRPIETVNSNYGSVSVKMLDLGVTVSYTNHLVVPAIVVAFGATHQITQPKRGKLLIMRKAAAK
jgi:hypothetical protein